MRQLFWAADGRNFLMTNTSNAGTEILRVDLQGSASVLRKCDSDRCFGLGSPDGRHVAVYDWKLTANMWMMENI
jgi:hypothetical protein